jgi:hypothetical protein
MPSVSVDQKKLGTLLCLIYSKSFFRAFPFQENRIDQWKLIYYIIRQSKTKLNRRELNVLLDKTPLGNEHAKVSTLLKDLHLKNCLDLEDKRGKAFPRTRKLLKKKKVGVQTNINLEKFSSRIGLYVACLLGELFSSDRGIPKIDERQTLEIMREVYALQILRHYSEWGIFVRNLATTVAATFGKDTAEFESEVADSSEHWLLLHIMWLKYLDAGNDLELSLAEILHAIQSEVTTFIKAPELRKGVRFLSDEGVFEITNRGKENVYKINARFLNHFDVYSRVLWMIREQLMEKLGTILRLNMQPGKG